MGVTHASHDLYRGGWYEKARIAAFFSMATGKEPEETLIHHPPPLEIGSFAASMGSTTGDHILRAAGTTGSHGWWQVSICQGHLIPARVRARISLRHPSFPLL